MQVPSILQGERPLDLIKGGIAGAILITAIGFNWAGYGFGWTLGGTAEQKVKDAREAAIVRVRYRLVETRRLHQGNGLCNFPRLRVRPKSG